MAQTLVTTCDRCKSVITPMAPDNRSHTVVKTYRSNDHLEVLTKDDLCASCTEAFEQFMTTNPKAK